MAHKISGVLQDMRKAVTAGEYQLLADLVPALEAAEAEAMSNGVDDPASVRTQAEQTSACLQAAILGVKSARRRMADILQAEKGLTTYDRTGTKATMPIQPPVSRRV